MPPTKLCAFWAVFNQKPAAPGTSPDTSPGPRQRLPRSSPEPLQELARHLPRTSADAPQELGRGFPRTVFSYVLFVRAFPCKGLQDLVWTRFATLSTKHTDLTPPSPPFKHKPSPPSPPFNQDQRCPMCSIPTSDFLNGGLGGTTAYATNHYIGQQPPRTTFCTRPHRETQHTQTQY